jgi:Na+-translocating ferredoxin:NAD+ oxidoreductase subunit B
MLARYLELPFLRISHRLFRGDLRRIGGSRIFRAIAGPLFYRQVARHTDSARLIPYEKLIKHIDSVNGAIAVGSCRCRITHQPCGHPIETDIVIRTGTAAWLKAFPDVYRTIGKEEAERIVTECHNLGMFHMLFHHCPSTACAEYVICNCCVCGCTIHAINRELGQNNFPLLASGWISVTNAGKCAGRGKCIEICPFGARGIENGKTVTTGCTGCGLCVPACPENAITMLRLETTEDMDGHN